MPLLVSREGCSALPSSLHSDPPCCPAGCPPGAYLQGQCLLRPHTPPGPREGGRDLGAEGSPAFVHYLTESLT